MEYGVQFTGNGLEILGRYCEIFAKYNCIESVPTLRRRFQGKRELAHRKYRVTPRGIVDLRDFAKVLEGEVDLSIKNAAPILDPLKDGLAIIAPQASARLLEAICNYDVSRRKLVSLGNGVYVATTTGIDSVQRRLEWYEEYQKTRHGTGSIP